jgi:CDP-ribitol ribitolphosphotransferase
MNGISDNYVFIFKMHPFERGKIKIDEKLSSKVFDMSNEEINDLLIMTDILITDYSSLIFEYAILQRPMIFFAYDLDEYRSKVRGFYYDYVKFVPGPIAYTTEEIVELINRNEWDFEVIKEFAIRFNEYFDGKATERFIDEVLFKHKVNIKKAGETI